MASSGGGGGGGGDEPYIAIVSKGFQHQFWQAVKQGAEEEAKAQGARITFQGPPTEQDIEQQVTMLTNALQKNPDAIGFAALDSKASAPLMDQAKAQNIPVVAFDSGVESDVPVTTAATDNKAAAAEAAKHLAELIGNKGKVAVIVHDQTSRSGIDRRDGFLEWMKAERPGHRGPPGAVRRRRSGEVRRHREVDHLREPATSRASTARTRARRSASSRASRRAARRASRSSASTPARHRSTPSRAA